MPRQKVDRLVEGAATQPLEADFVNNDPRERNNGGEIARRALQIDDAARAQKAQSQRKRIPLARQAPGDQVGSMDLFIAGNDQKISPGLLEPFEGS